jgi:hypothetical protein
MPRRSKYMCFVGELQADLVRACFASPSPLLLLKEIKWQTKLPSSLIPQIRNSINMLPPVDPIIVASNPKFEALYRDLTTNKLNKDGSSRLDVKAQKERDTLREVWQHLHRSLQVFSRVILIGCSSHAISFRGSECPNSSHRSYRRHV